MKMGGCISPPSLVCLFLLLDLRRTFQSSGLLISVHQGAPGPLDPVPEILPAKDPGHKRLKQLQFKMSDSGSCGGPLAGESQDTSGPVPGLRSPIQPLFQQIGASGLPRQAQFVSLLEAPLPWLSAQPLLLPHKSHTDLPKTVTSCSRSSASVPASNFSLAPAATWLLLQVPNRFQPPSSGPFLSPRLVGRGLMGVVAPCFAGPSQSIQQNFHKPLRYWQHITDKVWKQRRGQLATFQEHRVADSSCPEL